MADAIKDLVSNTNDQVTPAAPSRPKIITPPNPVVAPATPASAGPADEANDSVSVAHKKVIAPISDPTAEQPMGLDELLAKEGITNLDDEAHSFASDTQPTPTTNPALPSQPSLPTTPHPPGHVISPNNGVDPNSIAL